MNFSFLDEGRKGVETVKKPMGNVRSLVRGAYDIQQLRIQTGNRIVANYKSRMGIQPGKKETSEKEKKKILDDMRREYKKIADAVADKKRSKLLEDFPGTELISEYTEFVLVEQFVELRGAEARHFKNMEGIVKAHPLWDHFFKGVKGIKGAIGGVILSEIDIHRAKYVSSLHKLCGVDVGPDGRGRSKRKEHLIDVEYTNKKGELATKKSITYNPFLKTKLVGVLAGCFIRCDSPKYAQMYRDYKHRMENHAVYKDTTDLHRHRMAIRYMIKEFLADLYVAWRGLEGLPVHETYAVAKLGIVHGQEIDPSYRPPGMLSGPIDLNGSNDTSDQDMGE